MHYLLWGFSTGIFLPALCQALPGKPWFYSLLSLALAAVLFSRLRLPAFILLGVAYGGLWGHGQLEHRLPPALDKTDAMVTGVVHSLPDIDGQRARFEFRVDGVDTLAGDGFPPVKKLLLSWYGAETVRAGERWQFHVRLRTPRGFSNPATFDYETWLFAEGISATGYVRADSRNRLLDQGGQSFARLQQVLLDRLVAQGFNPETTGYLVALILGEQGLIPPQAVDRLVASGTIHLMVVSGLHVTLVSGLCFVLGLGIGRLLSALGCGIPAKLVASPLAMAGAVAYSMVAGMALPVQRALIMTLVVLFAILGRRRIQPWRLFAWALCGVALVDPMAASRPGFWLSFGAVAGLLWWFVPRPPVTKWRELVEAQLVIFVSLAGFLTFLQGSISLVSIPFNLVVVPWISLVVVPLALAGALLKGIPQISEFLWLLAGVQLDGFSWLLQWVTRDGAGLVKPGGSFLRSGDLWLMLAASFAAVLALMPRGTGLRLPLLVLVLAILFSRPEPPPFLQLTVLDVGQGLAVVVRAGERTLVYDAGPEFSPSFNTGSAVVAPYLASLGISTVDRLMVSHGDNDHAGGVAGFLARAGAGEIIVGQALPGQPEAKPCHRGMGWRWNGVSFRVLWPREGRGGAMAADNNRSCVLLIEAGDVSILLPGDIERGSEQALVREEGVLPARPLSLLVAAHHGSKTSSSAEFVSATKPAHVVFSAGFNHHFGHPHGTVVERFRQVGSTLWSTARSGAVTFEWDDRGNIRVGENRVDNRRYWHFPGAVAE